MSAKTQQVLLGLALDSSAVGDELDQMSDHFIGTMRKTYKNMSADHERAMKQLVRDTIEANLKQSTSFDNLKTNLELMYRDAGAGAGALKKKLADVFEIPAGSKTFDNVITKSLERAGSQLATQLPKLYQTIQKESLKQSAALEKTAHNAGVRMVKNRREISQLLVRAQQEEQRQIEASGKASAGIVTNFQNTLHNNLQSRLKQLERNTETTLSKIQKKADGTIKGMESATLAGASPAVLANIKNTQQRMTELASVMGAVKRENMDLIKSFHGFDPAKQDIQELISLYDKLFDQEKRLASNERDFRTRNQRNDRDSVRALAELRQEQNLQRTQETYGRNALHSGVRADVRGARTGADVDQIRSFAQTRDRATPGLALEQALEKEIAEEMSLRVKGASQNISRQIDMAEKQMIQARSLISKELAKETDDQNQGLLSLVRARETAMAGYISQLVGHQTNVSLIEEMSRTGSITKDEAFKRQIAAQQQFFNDRNNYKDQQGEFQVQTTGSKAAFARDRQDDVLASRLITTNATASKQAAAVDESLRNAAVNMDHFTDAVNRLPAGIFKTRMMGEVTAMRDQLDAAEDQVTDLGHALHRLSLADSDQEFQDANTAVKALSANIGELMTGHLGQFKRNNNEIKETVELYEAQNDAVTKAIRLRQSIDMKNRSKGDEYLFKATNVLNQPEQRGMMNAQQSSIFGNMLTQQARATTAKTTLDSFNLADFESIMNKADVEEEFLRWKTAAEDFDHALKMMEVHMTEFANSANSGVDQQKLLSKYQAAIVRTTNEIEKLVKVRDELNNNKQGLLSGAQVSGLDTEIVSLRTDLVNMTGEVHDLIRAAAHGSSDLIKSETHRIDYMLQTVVERAKNTLHQVNTIVDDAERQAQNRIKGARLEAGESNIVRQLQSQLDTQRRGQTGDKHRVDMYAQGGYMDPSDVSAATAELTRQEAALNRLESELGQVNAEWVLMRANQASGGLLGPKLAEEEARLNAWMANLKGQMTTLAGESSSFRQQFGFAVSDMKKLQASTHDYNKILQDSEARLNEAQTIMGKISRYRFPEYTAAGQDRLSEAEATMRRIRDLHRQTAADSAAGLLSPEEVQMRKREMQAEAQTLLNNKNQMKGLLKDGYTDPTSGAESIRMGMSAEDVAKSAKQFQQMFRGISSGAQTMMVEFVMAFIAIEQVLQRPVQAFAQFDEQIKKFTAVTFDDRLGIQEAEASAAAFERVALKVSANSRHTATQIASAGVEMGKMGLQARETADNMQTIVNAAEATGEKIEKVGEVVTGVKNAFQMTSSDIGNITDILSKIIIASPAAMDDMAVTFKYLGTVAQGTGQELEGIAAITTVMANNMILGSTAGTTMRQSLLSLIATTPEAHKALKALGVEVVDRQTGGFRELTDILIDLSAKMEGVTDATKTMALETIFGERAVSGMLAVVNDIQTNGADKFKALIESFHNVDGLTDTMKSISFKGVQAEFDKFKAVLENLKIEFGRAFEGMAVSFMQFATPVIQGFTNLSQAVKKGMAEWAVWGLAITGLGTVLTATTFAVTGFISAVSTMGSAMSTLNAFVTQSGGLMNAMSGGMALLRTNMAAALPTFTAAAAAITGTGTAAVGTGFSFIGLGQAVLASVGVTGVAATGFGALALSLVGLMAIALPVAAVVIGLAVAFDRYNAEMKDREERQANFNEVISITHKHMGMLKTRIKEVDEVEGKFAAKVSESTKALYAKANAIQQTANEYSRYARLGKEVADIPMYNGNNKDQFMAEIRKTDKFNEEELAYIEQSKMFERYEEGGMPSLKQSAEDAENLIQKFNQMSEAQRKVAEAESKRSTEFQRYKFAVDTFTAAKQAYDREDDAILKKIHKDKMDYAQEEFQTAIDYIMNKSGLEQSEKDKLKISLNDLYGIQLDGNNRIIAMIGKKNEKEKEYLELLQEEQNHMEKIIEIEGMSRELNYLGYKISGIKEYIELQKVSIELDQDTFNKQMAGAPGQHGMDKPGAYGNAEGLWKTIMGGKLYPGRYHEHKRTNARYNREGGTAKDLAAPEGTPIYAAQSAKVGFAGWENELNPRQGFGQHVSLDHGSGVNTLSAHMSKIAVKPGQFVRKGQIIGYVGSTGHSSGPHNHFEGRRNGQLYNDHNQLAYDLANITPMQPPAGYKVDENVSPSYEFATQDAYGRPRLQATSGQMHPYNAQGPIAPHQDRQMVQQGEHDHGDHVKEIKKRSLIQGTDKEKTAAQAELDRLAQGFIDRSAEEALIPKEDAIKQMRVQMLGAYNKIIRPPTNREYEVMQRQTDFQQFERSLEKQLGEIYDRGQRINALNEQLTELRADPRYGKFLVDPAGTKDELVKMQTNDKAGYAEFLKHRAAYTSAFSEKAGLMTAQGNSKQDFKEGLQEKAISASKAAFDAAQKQIEGDRARKIKELEAKVKKASFTKSQMDDIEAEREMVLERRRQDYDRDKEDHEAYTKNKTAIDRQYYQDIMLIEEEFTRKRKDARDADLKHTMELERDMRSVRNELYTEEFDAQREELKESQKQRSEDLKLKLEDEMKGYKNGENAHNKHVIETEIALNRLRDLKETMELEESIRFSKQQKRWDDESRALASLQFAYDGLEMAMSQASAAFQRSNPLSDQLEGLKQAQQAKPQTRVTLEQAYQYYTNAQNKRRITPEDLQQLAQRADGVAGSEGEKAANLRSQLAANAASLQKAQDELLPDPGQATGDRKKALDEYVKQYNTTRENQLKHLKTMQDQYAKLKQEYEAAKAAIKKQDDLLKSQKDAQKALDDYKKTYKGKKPDATMKALQAALTTAQGNVSAHAPTFAAAQQTVAEGENLQTRIDSANQVLLPQLREGEEPEMIRDARKAQKDHIRELMQNDRTLNETLTQTEWSQADAIKLAQRLKDNKYTDIIMMLQNLEELGEGANMVGSLAGIVSNTLKKAENSPELQQMGEQLGGFVKFLGDTGTIITGFLTKNPAMMLEGALNMLIDLFNFMNPGDSLKKKVNEARTKAENSQRERDMSQAELDYSEGRITINELDEAKRKDAQTKRDNAVKDIQRRKGTDQTIKEGEKLMQSGVLNMSEEEMMAYLEENVPDMTIPSMLRNPAAAMVRMFTGQDLQDNTLNDFRRAGIDRTAADWMTKQQEYNTSVTGYDKEQIEADMQLRSALNTINSGAVRRNGEQNYRFAKSSADIDLYTARMAGNTEGEFQAREAGATAEFGQSTSNAIADFWEANGGREYNPDGSETLEFQNFKNALTLANQALSENTRQIDLERLARRANEGNLKDEVDIMRQENKRGQNMFSRQDKILTSQESIAVRNLESERDALVADDPLRKVYDEKIAETRVSFDGQRTDNRINEQNYQRSLKNRIGVSKAAMSGDPVALAQAEGSAAMDALMEGYTRDTLANGFSNELLEAFTRESARQAKDNTLAELEAQKQSNDLHRDLLSQRAQNTFSTYDDIETDYSNTLASIAEQEKIDLERFSNNEKEKTRVNQEAVQKRLAAEQTRFNEMAKYYAEQLRLENELKTMQAELANNPISESQTEYEGKYQESLLETQRLNLLLANATKNKDEKSIAELEKLLQKQETMRKLLDASAMENMGKATVARYQQLEAVLKAQFDRDTRVWRFEQERNNLEIERLERVINNLNDEKQEIDEQLRKDKTKFGVEDRSKYAALLNNISLPGELQDALEYISNPTLNTEKDAGAETIIDAINTKTEYMLTVAESNRALETLSAEGESKYQALVASGLAESTLEIERQKLLAQEYGQAASDAYLLRGKAAQYAMGLMVAEQQEELEKLREEGKNANEIRVVEKKQMQERQKLIDLMQSSYTGYQENVRTELETTAQLEKDKVDEKVLVNEDAIDDIKDKNRELQNKIAEVDMVYQEKMLTIKSATELVTEATTRWAFGLDAVKVNFSALMTQIQTEYQAAMATLSQKPTLGIDLGALTAANNGGNNYSGGTGSTYNPYRYDTGSDIAWSDTQNAKDGNGNSYMVFSSKLGRYYLSNTDRDRAEAGMAKRAKGQGMWQVPMLSTNSRDDKYPAMVSSREIIAPYPEFNRLVSNLINMTPPGSRQGGGHGPLSVQFHVGTVYGELDIERLVERGIRTAFMEAGEKNAVYAVDNN